MPYLKLLGGFFSTILTILWILHIILYMLFDVRACPNLYTVLCVRGCAGCMGRVCVTGLMAQVVLAGIRD